MRKLKYYNWDWDLSLHPRIKSFQTRVDIYKLIKSIKLKKILGTTDNMTLDPFRPRSTFIPNVNDANINTFENVLLRDITILERQGRRPFLDNIASDASIVIKEAEGWGDSSFK